MPKKKKQTAPKNKHRTRKKSAKKTTPKRKTRGKTVSMRSPLPRKMKFSAKRRTVTSTGLVVETVPPPSSERREHRDGRAGDLQGLSDRPTSNSEGVEEGNALEAEAVQGVENALDANQSEVETLEVPEDDVPEYLE